MSLKREQQSSVHAVLPISEPALQSYDDNPDQISIEVGSIYEIDITRLPIATPVPLRSIIVAIVSEKAEKNMTINKYPSLESLSNTLMSVTFSSLAGDKVVSREVSSENMANKEIMNLIRQQQSSVHAILPIFERALQSNDDNQDQNSIQVDSIGKIDITQLLVRSPIQLKSIRVVIVSEKAEKNITVKYLSLEWSNTMSETFASVDGDKVFYQEVSSEEFRDNMTLDCFWRVNSVTIGSLGDRILILLKGMDAGENLSLNMAHKEIMNLKRQQQSSVRAVLPIFERALQSNDDNPDQNIIEVGLIGEIDITQLPIGTSVQIRSIRVVILIEMTEKNTMGETLAFRDKVVCREVSSKEFEENMATKTLKTSQAPDEFCIFVRTLRGCSRVVLVKKSDSIRYVKERLEKTEMIPFQLQELLYEFKTLENSNTIADYPNITKDSTLVLVGHLRGSTKCFPELSCAWMKVSNWSNCCSGSSCFSNSSCGWLNILKCCNCCYGRYRKVKKNEEDGGEAELTTYRQPETQVPPPMPESIVNPPSDEGEDLEMLTAAMRRRNVERDERHWEELKELVDKYRNSDKWIDYQRIKEATNNFSMDMEIGEGAQGTVYRGIFENKDVAIKKIEKELTFAQQVKELLLKEVEIISAFTHPNIVGYIGVNIAGEKCGCLYIVTEFLDKGDLQGLLSGKEPLKWEQRVKILLGVAEAINFLHTHPKTPVYFVDLKPSNVLVDSTYTAKLCDFGLSCFIPKDKTVTVHGYSVGYTCPVFKRTKIFNSASEVYQFGIVIFEVISGHKPDQFPKLAENLIKERKLEELVDPRMKADDDIPFQFEQLVHLARNCCDAVPEKRPTTTFIVSTLTEIQTKLKNYTDAGPAP